MPDSPDKDSQTEKPVAVDLSQLQGLSFGPNWSDSSSKAVARKSRDKRESSGSVRGDQRRDRRPAKPSRHKLHDGGGPGRDAHRGGAESQASRGLSRDGGRHNNRHGLSQVFQPTVNVLFYPEDLPFKALSQAIRRYCKTYELFEIAKLILEKPDRYVVVVKPKGKPEDVQPFHVSIPDDAPFATEHEALNHVVTHHMDKFFTIEETEVDPPKGTFSSVNKCGVTGELLGPPNYHRYQALVKEHHVRQLPNMPYARFAAKIESIKDEEVIAEWVKKMTKVMRYTLKGVTGDEVPVFDTLESAKNYLLAHCKDRIVGVREQARISGRLVDTLPEGPIKQSILSVLEMQRRFPLDTANNLRGRLRRMKFTIYKRGPKGASFVCSVKRRFRDKQTVFAEDINALIEYIEKNPNISVTALPKAYLGLELLAEQAVQPPFEKAPNMAAAEAVIQEASSDTAADASPAESTPVADESQGATSPEAAQGTESRADFVSQDLPQEDRDKIRTMMMSLQWLVQEGYVTEFGDGSLFAPPPQEAPKPKTVAVNQAAEQAVTELPAADAGQPVTVEAAAAPGETTELAGKKADDEAQTPPALSEPQRLDDGPDNAGSS